MIKVFPCDLNEIFIWPQKKRPLKRKRATVTDVSSKRQKIENREDIDMELESSGKTHLVFKLHKSDGVSGYQLLVPVYCNFYILK